MSPRKKNVITIEAWPNPKKDKLYKGIVRKLDINKKAKRVRVTIENIDPTQLGRIHEKTLLLPAHPGDRTSRFLTACGIDADTIGKKIGPEDVAGVTVGMRFGAVAQDGSQEVSFERIKDSQNEQPEISVEDSGDQSGQW